ncbi:MAG: hemerythrin domain-containing protein [Candidatus Electrothrix aestuarii]|uniref:Hemerythrin domain-containing protein n=1 Tax=Candidatus Electrothrix aestuarii TaxID=3062594 RepID=A0AAU8LYH0_9BACT|nr:hemerythrin domain-containing protein [Candidatus Electrothrix aestuarii]
MDKLTREAHEHDKLAESIVFFEKFLKVITSNDAKNYLPRLYRFADEYVVQHFKFEEQELFPTILKKGSSYERYFIAELLEDHKNILTALERFKESISIYEPQPDKEQVKKIIQASEEVISEIIAHARKEDKLLFPALKKYKV